jgi:N-methylhydantoinase B
MADSKTVRADPVTTEILRNGLVATTEEMKANLMRTAYNMIIYEALDFTVGLFDCDGNTISVGIGLPTFIRGMSNTVKAMIAHFGHNGMDEGDVLLTNDAYTTGSHLNHMTFVVPVFWNGEVAAFSACMAHWIDVGGPLNGMTMDIYSEGLQMPMVKAWRRGEENRDVFDIIRLNVRVPERAMGDLRAQIAAVRTGERRVLEMLGKYGLDQFEGAIEAIYRQSEAISREQISLIPDGVYVAESFMDDDGVDLGKPIPVKVKVIVEGDRMTVDLSEVGEQVSGFFNSGRPAGLSAAQVALKCIVAPLEMPINDGCFAPLEVILPEGKFVNATRPAPMRMWMTYPMTVIDTIFKALAPAIPTRVAAAHHADLVLANINGRHPSNRKLFLYLGGLIGGGWGAKHNEDGMCATIAINDGDTHNGPSEQVEAKYPFIIERYGLREDSGGAGRHRGGLGTEQIVKVLSDTMFNSQIERVENRPWGLFGGLSALGNQVAIRRGEKPETVYATGKVFSQLLKPGDAYVLRSGGGGGFGNPTERPLDKVEDDVRQGYVSIDAAKSHYGVVIDRVTLEPNLGASESLRRQMRALGLPKDQPLSSKAEPPAGGAVIPLKARRTLGVRVRAWQAEAEAAGLMRDRCCS